MPFVPPLTPINAPSILDPKSEKAQKMSILLDCDMEEDKRPMSDEDLALVLTELKAKIDQGDAAQFGRDVREVLLLVCRVCASRCKGDQHRALAEATTRLLPRDPVDPSVLPFLRPHFDRLFAARFESGPLNWSIVRDLHWAKKGARLDHDLPERPLMLFYLRPQGGYVIGFDAREDTHQVIEVPHGYEDLKNLASHALVANLWESMIESGSFDVYWSDDGLLSLLDSDSFPWSVPQGARIH